MDTSLASQEPQLAERRKRRGFMQGLVAAGIGGMIAGQSEAVNAACTVTTAPVPFLNVKSYGAVGNGVTDDTAAFQCTVDAAAAAGGGTILVPAGNYYLAGTVNITTNGITIQGMGSHTTTLLAPARMTHDMFRVANCLSGVIRNLLIKTSGAAATAGRAIHSYRSDLLIENLWIQNIFTSVEINGKYGRVTILGGYFNPAPNGTAVLAGNDLSVEEAVSELHIINLVVDPGDTLPQPAYGLRLRSVAGVWVTDCDFIRCNVGLMIDPPTGRSVVHGFFAGTAWDTAASRCIVIQPNS